VIISGAADNNIALLHSNTVDTDSDNREYVSMNAEQFSRNKAAF